MGSLYVGAQGAAAKIRKIYLGVAGRAMLMRRGYIGINGKARMFYEYTARTLPEPPICQYVYSGKAYHAYADDYLYGEVELDGETTGTEAGTYTVAVTPKEGYCWPDGTNGTRTVTWEIIKAPPNLQVSEQAFRLALGESKTITANYVGDGQMTVGNLNGDVVSCSVDEREISVDGLDTGDGTLLIRVRESQNYTGAELRVRISVSPVSSDVLGWRSELAGASNSNYALAAGGGVYRTITFRGSTYGSIFSTSALVMSVDKDLVVEAADSLNTMSVSTSQGPVQTGRSGLASATLNGDIYLMGGFGAGALIHDNAQGGRVVVSTGFGKCALVDLYDANLVHSSLDEMSSSRSGSCTGTTARHVFAMGGSSAGYGAMAEVDVYDENRTKVSAGIALSEERYALAGTSLGAYALAIGGAATSSEASGAIDAFDDDLVRRSVAPLATPRSAHCAARAGNYVVIMGGADSSGAVLSSVEAYNPDLTRVNMSISSLSAARRDGAAATLEDTAFLFGGASTKFLSNVDTYDGNLTHEVKGDLSLARSRLAAATVGGYALAMCGRKSDTVNDAETGVMDIYTVSDSYHPDGFVSLPSQVGTLTADGTIQRPSWDNNYREEKMIWSGDMQASAPGTYTAVFKPRKGYRWTDWTNAEKQAIWKIDEAPPEPSYWQQVKEIVEAGEASQHFSIGDQLLTTWTDESGNTYDFPLDVVDIAPVVRKRDGRSVPGLWLQAHYLPPPIQYDEAEALYYAKKGLKAGPYFYTFYNNTWTENRYFTLTRDIPSGGQLCIYWDRSIGGFRFYTYQTQFSTTPIEWGETSKEEISGAAYLGIEDDGVLNGCDLDHDGCGWWNQSSARQYYNSSAPLGQWWTPQREYDRPPADLQDKRGFLAGFPEDFASVLEPVQVASVDSYQSYMSGSIVSQPSWDIFFPPSAEQEYLKTEYPGIEGSYWPYWKMRTGETSPGPIFGSGTSYPAYEERLRYFLADHDQVGYSRYRTNLRGIPSSTLAISTNGHPTGYGSSNSGASSPVACVIC